MFSLLPSAMLAFLAAIALASPYPPSAIIPRQAESSPAPESPGITTLITSPNGTDITSSFKTLIYIPDDEDLAPSNLTDRSLTTRQADRTTRAINRCRHRPSRFKFSQCDHIAGHEDAMRRWNVTCSLPPYTPESLTLTEIGTCHRHEICINGRRLPSGEPTTASCVGKQRFVEPIPTYSTKAGRQRYLQSLRDRAAAANAAFSYRDGKTPMQVEFMRIMAGRGRAADGGGGGGGPTEQESCENCVDLSTEAWEKGTDALEMEATVAAGVGVATAGILWLAVLSG